MGHLFLFFSSSLKCQDLEKLHIQFIMTFEVYIKFFSNRRSPIHEKKLNFSSPAAEHLTNLTKKIQEKNEIKDFEKAWGRDCLIAFLPCSHSTANHCSGRSIFSLLLVFSHQFVVKLLFNLPPVYSQSEWKVERIPRVRRWNTLLNADISTKTAMNALPWIDFSRQAPKLDAS